MPHSILASPASRGASAIRIGRKPHGSAPSHPHFCLKERVPGGQTGTRPGDHGGGKGRRPSGARDSPKDYQGTGYGIPPSPGRPARGVISSRFSHHLIVFPTTSRCPTPRVCPASPGGGFRGPPGTAPHAKIEWSTRSAGQETRTPRLILDTIPLSKPCTVRRKSGPGRGSQHAQAARRKPGCLAGGEMGALPAFGAPPWLSPALAPGPDLRPLLAYQSAGPCYDQVCNDASRVILGPRNPKSVGQQVAERWSEIWHVIGPLTGSGESLRSSA